MSFNILTIRTGEETGDDALYPLLSDPSDPGLIAPDGYDGPNSVTVVATGVRVVALGDPVKTLVRLRDVKIDVCVTDGRVTLACEKYDKGGGWVGFGAGGLLVAVTANAVSKARAASRSRGKVLVGHVRYRWVKAVGAASKSGFGTEEMIRLEFCEKDSGATVHKALDLTLPKNIDATLVAQDIARRVVSYRLAHDPDMRAEVRDKFAALNQNLPGLQPQPRKFALYQFPTYYPANAATAFPPARQAGAAKGDVPPGPSGQPATRPDARHAAPSSGALGDSATPSGPDGRTVPPPTPGEPAPAPSRTGLAAAPRHGQAPVFCTRCGTRNSGEHNFCLQCGSPLRKATGSAVGPAAPAS